MLTAKTDFLTETFCDAAQKNPSARIILCDCGGVLFGEQYEGGVNRNLFHFLLALKEAGHDVRLMSETPRAYTPKVKALLKEAGYSQDYFWDPDSITISGRQELVGRKALIVIDSDLPYLHGINTLCTLDPEDLNFVEDLKMFEKPCTNLPDELRPDALFR